MNTPRSSSRWLNRTVLGIGLASLFSDWSHEIATTVMPAFLATMGVAAFWVGLIEGVSDGLAAEDDGGELAEEAEIVEEPRRRGATWGVTDIAVLLLAVGVFSLSAVGYVVLLR